MTMRQDTVRYGASRIRYGTTGRRRTGPKSTFYYCYYCDYYLFASSHESIHGRAAVEADKQAPKPLAQEEQHEERAAARQGQVGRLAIDRTFFLLAGEPYKVALACKGPSERAEELGCSLPISIPSRLAVLPSPFLKWSCPVMS